MASEGFGFCVWLLLHNFQRPVIRNLQDRLGGPRIRPHVTLGQFESRQAAEAYAASVRVPAFRAAARLRTQHALVHGASFHSLEIPLGPKTPALPDPHVSLVYRIGGRTGFSQAEMGLARAAVVAPQAAVGSGDVCTVDARHPDPSQWVVL
jgi:hypothetical protein